MRMECKVQGGGFGIVRAASSLQQGLPVEDNNGR